VKLSLLGKKVIETNLSGSLTGHQCDEILFTYKDMQDLYNMPAEQVKEKVGHLLTRFKYIKEQQ
jgi:hypothetical protein